MMGDSSVHSMLTRLMEEKHTFTYKKLVVPMSMRSPYWKYYGFPATDDGDILTKVKIICVLCKTQLAYNKNTSNLRMHLQNRHPRELMELIAEHPPETRPSPKQQAQQQTRPAATVTAQEIEVRNPRTTSKATKRKYHRSLENTDSGFTKQGNLYFTPADGSIEIDGDLQFMSDPNITISNFTEDESESNSAIQILASNSSSNSNVILQHVVEGKSVSDAVAEFVLMDLLNPDVVEGRGFQRLVATLRSPCEIPSRGRLVDEILPSMQNHLKEREQAAFENFSSDYGLSMEEWTSSNDDSFITISIHYQHKTEPQLESRVLTTVHCPSVQSGTDLVDYWSATLDSLFAEWHINVGKITAVVLASSRQEIFETLASKNLVTVPCLMFTLQECASLLFLLPEVHAVITKCRSLAALIHRHATAHVSLRMQESSLQVEESFTTDLSALWLTTHQMLEQALVRKSLFPSVLENIGELTPEQRLQFLLTDDEWALLDDIVTALGPFKVAVLTLSEERFPLLSLLEPLLWQLCSSHLQEKEGDSANVVHFKNTLSEQLALKYVDDDLRSLLRTSTILDPRFKTLAYADDQMKETVFNRLQKLLEGIVEVDDNPAPVETSPVKKSRLSGMALLLGNVCDKKGPAGTTEKAKLEIIQFKSEPSSPLDACPLQWWQQEAAKCPNLINLAKRFLCLPAAAMPGHRIPIPHCTLFYERRRILSPDQADTLLFLNANYDVNL